VALDKTIRVYKTWIERVAEELFDRRARDGAQIRSLRPPERARLNPAYKPAPDTEGLAYWYAFSTQPLLIAVCR
jgi:hypothetical protein